MMIACGQSEEEFDEKMTEALLTAALTICYDAKIHDEVSSAWRDGIFRNVTPSGKTCYDFNEAIDEICDSLEEYGYIEKAKDNNRELIRLISDMNPAPSSRKDCYDDLVAIGTKVSELTRMTAYIEGNYNEYKNKPKALFDDLATMMTEFKIKYGKFLKQIKSEEEIQELKDELEE